LHDYLIFGGAGRDRAVPVGPDGRRLDGAQQRIGNSGWGDTIWTFAVGLAGVGSALWPVAGAAPNARQWLVAALVAIWSVRLGLHIAVRTAGITEDPRYAAFAREWGVDSPR
jgi:steroid 5-alpha reductase family enzyme